ncbi:Hypothetical predicted protein [Podarcis lilfordi]|uniref:Uncharacterized protein n=1 Tax=Podarcis lilfordi TaxID=74358 RepID=A0AA35KVF5_9SAUR|nr:Hypothetical predicted protein [Podarcis lilfordi]
MLNKHKLAFTILPTNRGHPSYAQRKVNIPEKIGIVTRGLVTAENIIKVKFLPRDTAQNRAIVTFKNRLSTKQILSNKNNFLRAGLLVHRFFENIEDPLPLLGAHRPVRPKTKTSTAESNSAGNGKLLYPEAGNLKQSGRLYKTPPSPNKLEKDFSSKKEQLLTTYLEQILLSQDALIERLSTIRNFLPPLAPPPPMEFNYINCKSKPLTNEEWTTCRYLAPEETGSPTPPPTAQSKLQQIELVVPAPGIGPIFMDCRGILEAIHAEE